MPSVSGQIFAETQTTAANAAISIVVSGRAEIQDNKIDAAREIAKQIALTAALEETLGYYIVARSESENFESVYHKVISQTAGVVTIRKILKEEISGNDLVITLEASVSPMPVLELLRANGLLRDWRVMVVIPETHIARTIPDPAAETEFIRQFTAAGFKVLDQKVYARVRDKNSEIFRNERRMNAFARKAGADILVYGEAFSETANDASGGLAAGMVGCNARVETRAVALDTGEIFHADALNSRVPVLHTSESVAGKKAIQDLASVLAAAFVSKLVVRLAGVSRPHSLVVHGIGTIDQARRLQDALAKIKGVKKVRREHFSQNLLIIDLDLKATGADTLAEQIDKLQVKGLPLRVMASTRHLTKVQVFAVDH